MADTTTINKGFTKPEINASIDTWGNKLNADLDQLDGYFELGGGLKVAQGGTGATTVAAARTNLGLGDSATRNVGTAAGTVAAGDLTAPMTRAHTTTNPDVAPLGASSGDANIDGALRGWHFLTLKRANGSFGTQFALSDTESTLLFRPLINGVWQAWVRPALSTGATFTGAVAVPGASTVDGQAMGYRGAPLNFQPVAYTFALADAGRTVSHNSVDPHTYTIPADATLNFPVGTTIVVRNRPGNGAVTIAPATGVTLHQAGSTNTGARSVAGNGLVTLLKESGDQWVVSGAGLS